MRRTRKKPPRAKRSRRKSKSALERFRSAGVRLRCLRARWKSSKNSKKRWKRIKSRLKSPREGVLLLIRVENVRIIASLLPLKLYSLRAFARCQKWLKSLILSTHRPGISPRSSRISRKFPNAPIVSLNVAHNAIIEATKSSILIENTMNRLFSPFVFVLDFDWKWICLDAQWHTTRKDKRNNTRPFCLCLFASILY